MAFYPSIHKKSSSVICKTDFRFGVTIKDLCGTFIFNSFDNQTPILYKGKEVGQAKYSFIAGEQPGLTIFARGDYRISGQNPYKPLQFFETDINTFLVDSEQDFIFTGDYVKDNLLNENYEVMICPESGEFYLQNLRARNNDYSRNFALTRGQNYTIIGNRIEGLCKARKL